MTIGSDESNQESGGEFRQKFEQTLAEANALRALTAEKFGVSVDDLKGVAVDQIPTKAQEVLTARKANEEAVLKSALEARGLKGDDLDAALAQLKGGAPAPVAQQPAPSPFASTGSLGGTPPGTTQADGLFGVDRILAAVSSGSK